MTVATFIVKVVLVVKGINTKHDYPFCYIALDVKSKTVIV
ncbi:hypothetical protein CAT7_05911 [Carnobacterium sp. AT7]|nr:hypothetical protein CAT7_05911 [Carnobacterium sp. AT7]